MYYVDTTTIKQKWSSSGDTIYFNMIDYQDSDVNWVVLTALPESFFMANVYQTINITLAIMSIIIVLIFIGYIRLTYMIFKPLEELADMSDQLAEGDFNVQTKTYRDDEVGRLATSFNHMTKTIHSMITYQEEKVKKRTEELEIANKENNQRKEELKLILDTTVEGIFGIDIHGVVTFINKSGLKILGYVSEDEVIGKYIHKDIRYRPNVEHNEDISTCMIYQAMKQGMGQKSNDETFKKRDGSIVQVRFASYPQFQNHKIIGAVISFSDNSEEKKRQEEMEYISYHDYLTGLYNRRYFVETFELLDEEKNYPLGIIMVDLNALKLFNDAFGHYSGDKALIEVAKALRTSTKEKDVVCRLSGDEFAILVPRTSDQELEQIKINIKQRLADKTVENIMVTVAIGYESKTEKNVKLDVLLSHAENHMYRNKIIEGGRLKNNTINEIFEALITKHPHEKEHAELVSKLSEKMGKALGLKADSVKELSIAGLYHDIGKISISDDILSKQASLSEDEIEQMKKHTEIGYQILKTADAFSDLAIYALSHHENIDGSGYPRGLKGKEIPLFARIIRMIEAYAYMITNRPYHQKITQEEAIKELQKHSNTQFDPELVKVFIKKVILQEK